MELYRSRKVPIATRLLPPTLTPRRREIIAAMAGISITRPRQFVHRGSTPRLHPQQRYSQHGFEPGERHKNRERRRGHEHCQLLSGLGPARAKAFKQESYQRNHLDGMNGKEVCDSQVSSYRAPVEKRDT